MKLPGYSRYEIFQDGDTIRIGDLQSNRILQSKQTPTGVTHRLVDDNGKSKSFTQSRLLLAYKFCVSPDSFKIPRGGDRHAPKNKQWASDAAKTAVAINCAIDTGDCSQLAEFAQEHRSVAKYVACKIEKVHEATIEPFVELAEENVIDNIKRGKIDHIRPLYEMIAREAVRLYKLSKKETNTYKGEKI